MGSFFRLPPGTLEDFDGLIDQHLRVLRQSNRHRAALGEEANNEARRAEYLIMSYTKTIQDGRVPRICAFHASNSPYIGTVDVDFVAFERFYLVPATIDVKLRGHFKAENGSLITFQRLFARVPPEFFDLRHFFSWHPVVNMRLHLGKATISFNCFVYRRYDNGRYDFICGSPVFELLF